MIRETIRTISNAGKQVCAAICLSRFCSHYDISDSHLDQLIAHLWDFASIGSPDEFVAWDSRLQSISLTDLDDVLAQDVATVIPPTLLTDFSRLVTCVERLGMCDAYGGDTDGPIDYLVDTMRILDSHDISKPSLDLFTVSPHNTGWGMPVDPEIHADWEHLNPA